MDNKQIRQRICEYLMSATLKDCSMIFAFRKSDCNNSGTNTQDIIGQQSQFYNFRYIFFRVMSRLN